MSLRRQKLLNSFTHILNFDTLDALISREISCVVMFSRFFLAIGRHEVLYV